MLDKPVHLVVRFSDTMFSVGDVISLHNAVVAMNGAVWFGKLGQTISQKRMDILMAITSVFPISETLVRSSSGYFLVREGKSIF